MILLKMAGKEATMDLSESIESLEYGLKSIYHMLTLQFDDSEKNPMIQSFLKYSVNEKERLSKISNLADTTKQILEQLFSQYCTTIHQIQKEDYSELQILSEKIKNAKKEMSRHQHALSSIQFREIAKPQFQFSNMMSHSLDLELIHQYPGSYFWSIYNSGAITKSGDYYIDHNDNSLDMVLKYMRKEPVSLDALSEEDKIELLNDLDFYNLPVHAQFIESLMMTEGEQIYQTWKMKKYLLYVNGQFSPIIHQYLLQNQLYDSFLTLLPITNYSFDKKHSAIRIDLKLKYPHLLERYITKDNFQVLLSSVPFSDLRKLEQEFSLFHIHLPQNDRCWIPSIHSKSSFYQSKLIQQTQYEKVLQKWFKPSTRWNLIFRASEHNYSAKEFHDCCDEKGPTLLIIKSTGGWIFGGYTTQSWSGNSIQESVKIDSKAFLFTLKNPFDTEPFQLIPKNRNLAGIRCSPTSGPTFCSTTTVELFISDSCHDNRNSAINLDKANGFGANSSFGSSLFVNTNKMESINLFIVFDYEVFQMCS